MRRWLSLAALVLVVLATGCGTQAPATAPPQASDATPVAVSPAPAAPQGICDPTPAKVDPTESFRRREQLLVDAIGQALRGVDPDQASTAIGKVAKCISVESVTPGAGGKFLVVKFETDEPAFTRMYGLAVWQYEGVWHTASLVDDPIGNGLIIQRLKDTAAGFEVLALYRVDGTGGIGGFRLLRFGAAMATLWDGGEFDHFAGTMLSDQWLMATYRSEEVYKEPQFYDANCCQPGDGQRLWERQGDQYVQRAVRSYPSIYRAASSFAGAWNAGSMATAARWVTEPGVVNTMLGGATQAPEIRLADKPAGLEQIEKVERAHWDALPPSFNGPRPTVTEFIWPATPRPLLFRRVDGRWLVAGWQ